MRLKQIVLGGFLLLVVGLLISCGARTETSLYAYSPCWTRGGAVLYVGATSTVNKDIIGSQVGSSYAEYLKTIYPSGTGESSILADTTASPAYVPTCSPLTDYVAYGTNLRSGLYRNIIIQNISSGTHTGMERTELTFVPGIKAFDWSSDGTKLVYCTSTEIRTVSIYGTNDTLVTAESDLEFVSWKYGNKIAFIRNLATYNDMSFINEDGTGRVTSSFSYAPERPNWPQFSPTNTDVVYYLNPNNLGQNHCIRYYVTSATAEVVSTSYINAASLRVSPTADLVAYSKTAEATGIYALDVTTAVESKIK